MDSTIEPGFQLDQHLREQQALFGRLAQGDGVGALELYLGDDATSIRKPNLEWKLASLLLRLDNPGVGHCQGWPADRLDHPAGAALCLVVAQVTQDRDRNLDPLPPGLATLPPLPARNRALLARAWLRYPQGPAFGDRASCRSFALWLARHPPSLGVVLLAVARRGDDPDLVRELAVRWLHAGLFHPEAARHLVAISRLPALAQTAQSALAICLGRFFEEDEALIDLLEPALTLRQGELVVSLTSALLRRTLPLDKRNQVLACRLLGLAIDERWAMLAEEYREYWIPLGEPFPWPERLLYVFQKSGEDELARHLVADRRAAGTWPRWMELTARFLETPRVTVAHLQKWEEAYTADPQDERILVGVTRAVLAAPLGLKQTWVDRLGIAERWVQLAEFEGFRELGSAYLVLLAVQDETVITDFEQRLSQESLESLPARKAAQRYVQALRRTRQWPRLRSLLEGGDDRLACACTFAEWEMVRLLSRLEALPSEDRSAERGWCGDWEQLLSLPLTQEEVVEVLNHFVNLQRTLEVQGGLRHEFNLFQDVTLQVLRRAKAALEALLRARGAPPARISELRQQIMGAGPAATLKLLQEILVEEPPP
jgi:hypothetical protein